MECAFENALLNIGFFFKELRDFLKRVLKKLFVREEAVKTVGFKALIKETIIDIASNIAVLL